MTADQIVIIASAKALIIATAFAVSGGTRDDAELAIWKAWGAAEFDADQTGVALTPEMSDQILTVAFGS